MREYSDEEKLRFSQFLNSTKRRKIDCGLSIDEYFKYQSIQLCQLTGMPLVCGKTGRISFNTRTLERVDHNLGYVNGNILVVCHSLNKAKAKYEDPNNSRFSTDMDSLELLKSLASKLVSDWNASGTLSKMLEENNL